MNNALLLAWVASLGLLAGCQGVLNPQPEDPGVQEPRVVPGVPGAVGGSDDTSGLGPGADPASPSPPPTDNDGVTQPGSGAVGPDESPRAGGGDRVDAGAEIRDAQSSGAFTETDGGL